MSGVRLGGRESDLTIPECGLAIMITQSQTVVRLLRGASTVRVDDDLSLAIATAVNAFTYYSITVTPHHSQLTSQARYGMYYCLIVPFEVTIPLEV